MKLKKLTIHNLASLADAVVPFDEAPLADEPIFLIDGPTGAGKSTLLDAVCLALYNQVPRLSGGVEKAVRYTEIYNAARGKNSDQTVEQERAVALDDPRQLMRRGTAECKVTLSFDVAGEAYEAAWSVCRANGRADGNMKNVEWTLLDSDGTTLDKATAVAERIVSLVGLTFDQFCRTVMLAQGEFTKFIQSRIEDKSAILQKITGTEIYEKIGMRIGTRHAAMENALKLLRQRQGDICLFAPEELAERQAALAALQLAAAQQQRQQQALTAQRDWLKRDGDLRHQRQTAQATRQAAQAVMETESYQREQRDMADYASTAEPRIWLEAKQNAESKQARLRQEEARLQRIFASLDAERGTQESRSRQLADALRHAQEELAGMAALQPMLDEAQGLLALLAQLHQDEAGCGKEQQSIAAEKERKAVYEKVIDEAQAKKEAADKAVALSRQALEQQHGAYERLQPAAAASESKALNERQKNLMGYGGLVTALQHAEEQREKAIQELDKAQKSAESFGRQVAPLQQAMETAKQSFDRDNDLYESFKDALGENFVLIRKHLHRGDSCPLCGAAITAEAVADPDLDAVVRPKLTAMEQSRADLVEAQSAYGTNMARKADSDNQVRKLKKQLEESQTACSICRSRLLKGWTVFWPCETSPDGAATASFAERMAQEQREIERQQHALEKRQQEINAAAAEVTRLNKEKDSRVVAQTATDAALAGSRNEMKLYAERLALREAALTKKMAESAAQRQLLRGKLLYPDWESRWQQDAQQVTERLRQDAGRYQELKEKQQRVGQEKSILDNTLQAVSTIRERIWTVRPAWQEDAPALAAAAGNASQLLARWQLLQSDYDKWAQAVAHAQEERQENNAKLADYYHANPAIDAVRLAALMQLPAARMQQLSEAHRAAEAEIAKEKGRCDTLEEQWRSHCENKPATPTEEDGPAQEEMQEQSLAQVERQLEAVQKQQADTQHRAGSMQRDLETDEENRRRQAQLLQETARAEEEKQRWDILYKYFGDNDGKKFRNVAQSFILRHLLDKANRYLRCFTDRYELTCEPGSLVILVQDRLTNLPPQYVKVLSGGESFMVSLSLALALAQLNTHVAGVDILFIDEGFGTLDETNLASVMETLSRLHEMGGRKVGIISHVEDLARLIRTQIQVTPVSPSQSEVTVVTL